MKLQSLIKLLQEIELKEGNIAVYTNSEHGADECIALSAEEVSAGLAEIELDEDSARELQGTRVVHIGGY